MNYGLCSLFQVRIRGWGDAECTSSLVTTVDSRKEAEEIIKNEGNGYWFVKKISAILFDNGSYYELANEERRFLNGK